MSVVDLIALLPDDKPDIFYQKMICLPESRLNEEVLKFERYEKYAKILRFHESLLKRPDVNVRVLHNDRNGIHLSCCDKSISNISENIILCTCEQDFNNIDTFFWGIKRDEFDKLRCTLCKSMGRCLTQKKKKIITII